MHAKENQSSRTLLEAKTKEVNKIHSINIVQSKTQSEAWLVQGMIHDRGVPVLGLYLQHFSMVQRGLSLCRCIVHVLLQNLRGEAVSTSLVQFCDHIRSFVQLYYVS